MSLPPRYIRIVLSYLGTAVSFGVCSAQGDVHLELGDLSTFTALLSNTCGRITLFFAVWAVAELVNALLFPHERDTVGPPVAHTLRAITR